MTDLTDKWKKGELPNGWYWCECYNEEIKILYYDGDSFELNDPETKNYYFFLKKDSAEIAILEKASYEEWQANQKWIKHLEEVIKIYERKDKQATETSIAYNELLNENTKLKELLKRVVNATVFYHEIKTASVVDYGVWYNIANEIKQVLGEE